MPVTRFGQLVIGPPGAGKTTYVGHMTELLRGLKRKVAIVNLVIKLFLEENGRVYV